MTTKTVTIKNMPDEVWQRAKIAAAVKHMTVHDYMIELITENTKIGFDTNDKI